MCGLAGYANVTPAKRLPLAFALGLGTDTRGGHAAGYVASSSRGVAYARKEGQWSGASAGFVIGASSGDVTIIHARYATCGVGGEAEAHPFRVARNGRTVLWGAHNGIVHGTVATALARGRAHDVDSREIFELLADGELAAIATLQGYGTLAWLDARTRDRVYLVRMTEDAALEIASTACGALVWGSTRAIVERACSASSMAVESWYETPVGRVLEARANGVLYYSAHANVTVSERWTYNAGDLGAADKWEEDYCPPCPSCDSEDTWLWGGEGHCAACGYDFPADVATTADATPEGCDGWTDAEWDAWEVQQAREDAMRDAGEAGDAMARAWAAC